MVWLNAGSRLRYPVRFAGGKREVELRGEAYFEVEADRKSPFYVHTDAGMSVYVYGTSFNVNAYDDEPAIRTVLEKGQCERRRPPHRTTVRIEPGEQVVFDRRTGALTCSQVRVEDECAWRDGRLVFRNTPLDEVLHRLARHYNVDIEFRNHSDEVFRYRATFRDETLPQILRLPERFGRHPLARRVSRTARRRQLHAPPHPRRTILINLKPASSNTDLR